MRAKYNDTAEKVFGQNKLHKLNIPAVINREKGEKKRSYSKQIPL